MGNVTAAKPKVGGAVYVAPSGTTLPTDASTALAAAFVSLGYISDDGITNSNSPQTDGIKAWGGTRVLTLYNEKDDDFKTKLIDTLDINVLKLVYGDDNVTSETADGKTKISIKANNNELPEKVFVIDMLLTDDAIERLVIPRGTISEVGDISYKDSEAKGFDVTISALSDTAGQTHYDYIEY